MMNSLSFCVPGRKTKKFHAATEDTRFAINLNQDLAGQIQNSIFDVSRIHEKEANDSFTSIPRNNDTPSSAAAKEDGLFHVDDV